MKLPDELKRKIVNIHPTSLFDPAEHVIPNEKGDPYLSVTDKRLWFRAVYPKGVIRKEILSLSETAAHVHVRVYADASDAEDNYIAEGYARRVLKNEPYKEYFLEEAFRAAVRVALTEAGFATGFAEAEGEPEEGESYTKNVSHPAPVVPNVALPVVPPIKESTPNNSWPIRSVISPDVGIPVGQEVKKNMVPVVSEEPKKLEMTLEEAFTVKSNLRNSKGQTLRQLVEDSPDPLGMLRWIVNEYSGRDLQFKTAAGIILVELESKMNQAA